MVKVLHDAFGIRQGYMVTIHSKDHLAWIDAMSGMLFYPSPEGPPEAMAS